MKVILLIISFLLAIQASSDGLGQEARVDHIISSLQKVIHSDGDERECGWFTMPNDLRVLLVRDQNLEHVSLAFETFTMLV